MNFTHHGGIIISPLLYINPTLFWLASLAAHRSFEAIERWMKKVDQHAHPNAVRTLVGNKLDDSASRQVPTLTALNFAKHHEMDFCEGENGR